jgi:murein L,D-transpeptidase YcbB/YkuD
MSITAENAYSDMFLDSAAVEAYISKEKLSDTLATALRGFYNTRNFQYAWFSSNGLTEQGRSFWYLYEYNDRDKKENDSLAKTMDTLVNKDSLILGSNDSTYHWLELNLTKEFVEYRQQNRNALFAATAHPVPVKKMDVMQLADSILNKQKDTAQFGNNSAYSALKKHLSTYYDIARNGGWQMLTIRTKQMKKGIKSPEVTLLKKRLQLSGDYGANDTTNISMIV